jgi:hypothetical protein
MGNWNGDCTSRRASAHFADESHIASRETVIVIAGGGLTRVVKIDVWNILLFDVGGERIGSSPPGIRI